MQIKTVGILLSIYLSSNNTPMEMYSHVFFIDVFLLEHYTHGYGVTIYM